MSCQERISLTLIFSFNLKGNVFWFQLELEKLNTSTAEINKLELELDVSMKKH